MSVNLSDEAWPASVEPELATRIVNLIVEEGMLDRAVVRPGVTLDELDFDSLEAIMVINGIENAFDIELSSDIEWSSAQNMGELVDLLATAIKRAAPSQQS